MGGCGGAGGQGLTREKNWKLLCMYTSLKVVSHLSVLFMSVMGVQFVWDRWWVNSVGGLSFFWGYYFNFANPFRSRLSMLTQSCSITEKRFLNRWTSQLMEQHVDASGAGYDTTTDSHHLYSYTTAIYSCDAHVGLYVTYSCVPEIRV